MPVFDKYAEYYDLLYKDKDYRKEADYIENLIIENSVRARTILEFGCGTGIHSELLRKKGFEITGIDFSEQMITAAKLKYPDGNFINGDIRDIDLREKFDVVISLFHVMSYQKSNEDLLAAFNTASMHLKKGGLFIFDCWYGPAVLSNKPETRIKRLENGEYKIMRICESDLYLNENYVDVNYEILIENKMTKKIDKIKEKHSMRYLFKPEVEQLMENHNINFVKYEEWMTKKIPDTGTWGVCFLGSKV